LKKFFALVFGPIVPSKNRLTKREEKREIITHTLQSINKVAVRMFLLCIFDLRKARSGHQESQNSLPEMPGKFGFCESNRKRSRRQTSTPCILFVTIIRPLFIKPHSYQS